MVFLQLLLHLTNRFWPFIVCLFIEFHSLSLFIYVLKYFFFLVFKIINSTVLKLLLLTYLVQLLFSFENGWLKVLCGPTRSFSWMEIWLTIYARQWYLILLCEKNLVISRFIVQCSCRLLLALEITNRFVSAFAN